jgi:hypothetical protein
MLDMTVLLVRLLLREYLITITYAVDMLRPAQPAAPFGMTLS